MLQRPDITMLVWSALAALAAIAVLGAAWWPPARRRLPDPSDSEMSTVLGDEPPAVVNVVTNDFRVTPAAASATLIDLAARGWVRIDDVGGEVAVFPQRAVARDPLARHEQQLLNHLQRLSPGPDTGVSSTGLAVAGVRLSPRWRRRFARSIVGETRRRGLSRRRLPLVAVAIATVVVAAAGWLWWTAHQADADAAPGRRAPIADSLADRAWGVAVAVATVVAAVVVVVAGRSQAERPRPAGAEAAARWLGTTQQLAARDLDRMSAAAPRSIQSGQILAYAAAIGLAETGNAELPVLPEDDRRALSSAGGRWRSVAVRYPLRPAYGRHPLTVLIGGIAGVVAMLALQRFALDVRRGVALQSVVDDVPDQADLIRGVALGVAIAAIGPLVLAAWWLVAGATDLFAALDRRGLVVRARQPGRVHRPFDLLRRFGRRDRYSVYLAVDDGRTDTVTARLASERTSAPQGAAVHLVATPLLGYVRRCDTIGSIPTLAPRRRAEPAPVTPGDRPIDAAPAAMAPADTTTAHGPPAETLAAPTVDDSPFAPPADQDQR